MLRGWAAVVLCACGRLGFDEVDPQQPDPVETPQLGQLTVGWRHSCVRGEDGTALCWGDNGNGQLGNNEVGTDVRKPTVTASGIKWADLSAGETHTCGLDTAGVAYCWGTNGNGQLGIGVMSGPPVPVPTQIDGARTYRRIFAGSRHTCAIATDNTLWCWGRNGARQLGVGGNADKGSPTQVKIVAPQTGPDNQWAVIGPGDDHTCATQLDATAWCWGSEADGQLGVGMIGATRDSPQRVAGGLAFKSVAAGRNFSGGIGDGGVLATWGLNNYGQLGLGDEVQRLSPTPGMTNNHDVISLGVTHACAHRETSITCWGSASQGEIGNGMSSGSVYEPFAVPGEWLTVGCGLDYTCALDVNQFVWCWGSGVDGRLGTGNTNKSLVPLQITGQPR